MTHKTFLHCGIDKVALSTVLTLGSNPPCSTDIVVSEFGWIFSWTLGAWLAPLFEKDGLTNPCRHFWSSGFSGGPLFASSIALKFSMICSNTRFLAIVESFLQMRQFSNLEMQLLQTIWPLAHWCIGVDLIGAIQAGHSKRLLMYSSNLDAPCSADFIVSEY